MQSLINERPDIRAILLSHLPRASIIMLSKTCLSEWRRSRQIKHAQAAAMLSEIFAELSPAAGPLETRSGIYEGCNCRGLGPTRVVLSACIDPKTLNISLTDRREFRLPPALYASFYTIMPCKRQNWHHAEAQLRDLIESMN